MIPITINKKKYQVKPIAELTTAEFMEVVKIEGLTMVKYIAWSTGLKMEEAFFAITSNAVNSAIGIIPDISKLPRPDCFDYSNIIETVGQRHQIEASKLKDYELLVFVLAVSQAKSNNIDDVYKLRDEYMNRPFMEILPAALFFFRILAHGKSSVLNILKTLFSLISIRKSKNKLELTG